MGVCGGGVCVSQHALKQTPPSRWLLLQAVCILLECTLVFELAISRITLDTNMVRCKLQAMGNYHYKNSICNFVFHYKNNYKNINERDGILCAFFKTLPFIFVTKLHDISCVLD